MVAATSAAWHARGRAVEQGGAQRQLEPPLELGAEPDQVAVPLRSGVSERPAGEVLLVAQVQGELQVVVGERIRLPPPEPERSDLAVTGEQVEDVGRQRPACTGRRGEAGRGVLQRRRHTGSVPEMGCA